MAGIGFVLRKLYRQDNLIGLARACMHSTSASAGPWLFTVLALGLISILGKTIVGLDTLFYFRALLIYNFCFSLVLSGPIFMVVTRYLSDSIYRRDVSGAPGMLFGALVLIVSLEGIVAGYFYLFYAHLPVFTALSAIVDFLLLSAIWLLSIFISAVRNYRLITGAFVLGMATAVGACTWLGRHFGAVGMLNGFSLGLAVIAALLLANVLAEYPYPIKEPFAFLKYFRKFWDLALCGFIYNAAIWVDKWIMWFTPEATKIGPRLAVYPHYDSAMFLAYLTTVPAMALFLFSAETGFFEHYMRFYRHIEQKASYAKIEKNHRNIVRNIFGNAENFFILQGSIAAIGILTSPGIIFFLHGHFLQVGMLRYGILGALFQVLTLFIIVLFSYFDNRRANLFIQLMFLVTNGLFTYASLFAGFRYYGFGYFLACFFTFVVSAVLLKQYVERLPYYAFVTTNTSVG